MSTNTANLTNYHPQSPKRTASIYDDIINCKRPYTKTPMDIASRAAQFSPYAALVGHKDIIAADEVLVDQTIDREHEIIFDNETNLC